MHLRHFLRIILLVCLMTEIHSSQHIYEHTQGEKGEERLTILNELYNPLSMPVLKIAPGMNILTIGCGIGLLEVEMAKMTGPGGSVIATDMSEDQLYVAEKNRRAADVDNLKFIKLDGIDIEKIPGHFDRVHCRLVLSHMSWEKAVQIVPLLYSKLAPGGLLIMEEISSIESLCANKEDPGFEMYRTKVLTQFKKHNLEMSTGKKLFQKLQDEGYAPSFSLHHVELKTPREKSLLRLGLQSVEERALKDQIMTPQEVEELYALLFQLEQNPSVIPRYHEVIQITVQRQ